MDVPSVPVLLVSGDDGGLVGVGNQHSEVLSGIGSREPQLDKGAERLGHSWISHHIQWGGERK